MQHRPARATPSIQLRRRPRTGIVCQDNEPDLWFADDPDTFELAKWLCLACPMREACVAGALVRAEPWGVWGGQLFLNGVIVAGKRRRGRPRKDEAA